MLDVSGLAPGLGAASAQKPQGWPTGASLSQLAEAQQLAEAHVYLSGAVGCV